MYDIYVINLKKRNDRMERITNLFKEFININMIRIEAVEEDEGWIGCAKSHIKCIKLAKDNNLPYIIVIEDDCEFVEDFENKLKLIINYLEQHFDLWDIFLGGVSNVWKCDFLHTFSDYNSKFSLVSILKGKCAHFVIYNKSIYDFYLNLPINQPIDKVWYNNAKCLVSVPFIAKQIVSYSDIEKRETNYYSRIDSIENEFKKYLDNI